MMLTKAHSNPFRPFRCGHQYRYIVDGMRVMLAGGVGIVVGLTFFSARVIRTLGVRVCKVKLSHHQMLEHNGSSHLAIRRSSGH
jgi:phosphate/sulfate permease